MPRITPFSIGRRWRCDNIERQLRGQPPFDFVILGPGVNAQNKIVRIEVVGHGPGVCWNLKAGRCSHACHHGLETEFSLRHLKKFGVLQEIEASPT